jgi:hypothetical protein
MIMITIYGSAVHFKRYTHYALLMLMFMFRKLFRMLVAVLEVVFNKGVVSCINEEIVYHNALTGVHEAGGPCVIALDLVYYVLSRHPTNLLVVHLLESLVHRELHEESFPIKFGTA